MKLYLNQSYESIAKILKFHNSTFWEGLRKVSLSTSDLYFQRSWYRTIIVILFQFLCIIYIFNWAPENYIFLSFPTLIPIESEVSETQDFTKDRVTYKEPCLNSVQNSLDLLRFMRFTYTWYILTTKSKNSQVSSTLTEDVNDRLHCLWIYSWPF